MDIQKLRQRSSCNILKKQNWSMQGDTLLFLMALEDMVQI